METAAALIIKTLDRHLTHEGEIRLFGGAALVLGYGLGRETEDADLLLDDAECLALISDCGFSEAVAKTNTELAPRGLYLTHIWGPEQQILSPEWRPSCRLITVPGLIHLRIGVLGPIDMVLSKLARADEGDLEDIRWLIQTQNLTTQSLRQAVARAVVPEILREVFTVSVGRLNRLIDEMNLSA